MADQEPKTDNPGINEDDTRTRKTVRLKSSAVTPTSIKLPAAAPIADPLTGRDTDTGNLDVLADTQTRRTVRLKPLAPQKAANTPIKLQGAGVTTTTTVNPVAPDGQNTQTRKTVMLKPATPTGINLDDSNTQTRKTVVLRPSVATPASVNVTPKAPAPAPAAKAEDTSTRKTVSLRPSMATPAGLKITPAAPVTPAAPAATAAPAEEDDTRTRKTVTLKPSAVTPAGLKIGQEDAEDATIRIQRPPRKTPAPTPAAPAAPAPVSQKQTVKLDSSALVPEESGAPRRTVELSAEAPVPENEVQKTMKPDTSDLVDEKATVKLSRPKAPVPPIPPSKQTGEVEVNEPEQAPEAEAQPEGEKAPAAEEAVVEQPKKKKAPRPEVPGARRPSVAYLVMAAITLILMIGTAALTTVQYLNLCQNQSIELPVLGK